MQRHFYLVLLPFVAFLLLGCQTLKTVPVSKIHAEELRRFQEASRAIEPLLSEEGLGQVSFPATLSAHSGPAVAMLAPVRGSRTPAELVTKGGIFGVLWLSDDPVTSSPSPALQRGIYALRFRPEELDVYVDLIRPGGNVAYRIPARLKPGIEANIQDEIEDKLRELDIDVTLVDVEIVFGDPTKVRGSILFWTFDLFDDP